jgi:hypothetical protein
LRGEAEKLWSGIAKPIELGAADNGGWLFQIKPKAIAATPLEIENGYIVLPLLFLAENSLFNDMGNRRHSSASDDLRLPPLQTSMPIVTASRIRISETVPFGAVEKSFSSIGEQKQTPMEIVDIRKLGNGLSVGLKVKGEKGEPIVVLNAEPLWEDDYSVLSFKVRDVEIGDPGSEVSKEIIELATQRLERLKINLNVKQGIERLNEKLGNVDLKNGFSLDGNIFSIDFENIGIADGEFEIHAEMVCDIGITYNLP